MPKDITDDQLRQLERAFIKAGDKTMARFCDRAGIGDLMPAARARCAEIFHRWKAEGLLMSLDVYLYGPDKELLYEDNITHNLNRMAAQVDLYYCLWHPEELGIVKAHQLIRPLTAGLNAAVLLRKRLLAFNPANGWGDYPGLLDFCRRYLAACLMNPDANVGVSR